jgi:hypothetical protein
MINKSRSMCEWTYDNEGFFVTQCDNAFQFNEGGPKENGFIFCPYCGQEIIIDGD